MKRLIPALIVVSLSGSCGPSAVRQTAETSYRRGKGEISDLEVSVNHRSMVITWKRLGQGTISGYNIYISRRPLAGAFPDAFIDSSIKPYNPTPFPGDTEPDDGVETFEANELENGVRYFVTVRTVYPDGSLSVPSEEVPAVCGPRGEIELPIRYQSSPDGFSFEKNAYTDANSVDNDLYFFSKDGHDYLASPRRLDGFINDTRFQVLPFRGYYEEVVANLARHTIVARDDQVEISVGDWVLARCGRGTSALVEVKAISGSDRERRVVLFFAYSAARDEILF